MAKKTAKKTVEQWLDALERKSHPAVDFSMMKIRLDRLERKLSDLTVESLQQTARTVAVRVEPGDTIVVRLAMMLDANELGQVRAHFKATFPNNEVLVLTGGLDVNVLKADPQEAQEAKP